MREGGDLWHLQEAAGREGEAGAGSKAPSALTVEGRFRGGDTPASRPPKVPLQFGHHASFLEAA